MTNGLDAATQNEVDIQRAYYARIADRYDAFGEAPEHALSLRFLVGAARYIGVDSILEVGSGTGRGLVQFARDLPDVEALGIEPSAELREVGYSKGLSKTHLIHGDAMKLDFEDNSFDLVCEFGALHHMPHPSRAVAEMLRVARKAIFISDCNNFGQGGSLSRLFKQAINSVGLWPLVDWIKTGGKGYRLSESDGLAYSYSVFDDYKQIKAACKSVHMLNTSGGAVNLYRNATHVALLGIKR